MVRVRVRDRTVVGTYTCLAAAEGRRVVLHSTSLEAGAVAHAAEGPSVAGRASMADENANENVGGCGVREGCDHARGAGVGYGVGCDAEELGCGNHLPIQAARRTHERQLRLERRLVRL